MDRITTSGLHMPKLGLGTWPMSGSGCTDAVLRALAIGYRHIDTAQMYGNEAEIGAALAQTDVKRADIHVTTKVSREFLAPDAMRRVAEESLRKLRLDYVDLYLIHWPAAGMDVQRAMESLMRLQAGGLAKHIGVSNFPVALMRRCIEEARAPIVCNQVEYHVMLDQTKVLAYARAHGIAVTAYCPLARGNLGEVEALARIARKHGATPAQIALKWLLDQDGVAAIPKASRAANQQENWDAQKIVLDGEDRAAIAALPKSRRIVNPAAGPKWDEAA
ncbi:MAG TPA: aldo/keto reductase [Acetobacteraceae bacterium]|nr:aldo/keto reductase [Acetobacteraceae bacterium]